VPQRTTEMISSSGLAWQPPPGNLARARQRYSTQPVRSPGRFGILGPIGHEIPLGAGSTSTWGILDDWGPVRPLISTRADNRYAGLGDGSRAYGDAYFDTNNASLDDGAELIEIIHPERRRLRRQYEREIGAWPRDPVTGRNYDVAHRKALADGGKNTLDNIRPMHPDAHRAEHKANGDSARWGKRPHIARAYGGTVARGYGVFSILPTLLGIVSGRLRAKSIEAATADMLGIPPKEEIERQQREINPRWKRGDPIITVI
jgi:hypothetical protein